MAAGTAGNIFFIGRAAGTRIVTVAAAGAATVQLDAITSTSDAIAFTSATD